ncbi:MAG: sugar phosphate isomerase/epimerase family protein [Thermoguttaceae bacterium]
MQAWQLGVELAGLGLPFRQALDAAADWRVQAVKIAAHGELAPQNLSRTATRQIRKMLDDRKLRISAVGFAARVGCGRASQWERCIEDLKAVMEPAYRLGAPIVVAPLARLPNDREPQARAALIDLLGDLGRHAARTGVILAVQTGPHDPKQLASLLARMPEGLAGVELDPGRLLLNDFSPVEAVWTLGGWVVHVCATDARRGPAPGRPQFVTAGQGNVHYAALLAALEEHRYRGFLSVRPPDSRDPLQDAAASLEYLRTLRW